jgi:hypothetical protein
MKTRQFCVVGLLGSLAVLLGVTDRAEPRIVAGRERENGGPWSKWRRVDATDLEWEAYERENEDWEAWKYED